MIYNKGDVIRATFEEGRGTKSHYQISIVGPVGVSSNRLHVAGYALVEAVTTALVRAAPVVVIPPEPPMWSCVLLRSDKASTNGGLTSAQRFSDGWSTANGIMGSSWEELIDNQDVLTVLSPPRSPE